MDTNAVIDYLGEQLPRTAMLFMSAIIDTVPNVSVITRIEVLGFHAPPKHHNLLCEFMDDAVVFDLTEDIVNKTIEIRQRNKIKLPDAIIAATAIVHDLVLVTRNSADFKHIQDLKFLNAWDK